jgi:hypothetical protein
MTDTPSPRAPLGGVPEEVRHELDVLWHQAMTYQARGDEAAKERMTLAHRRILAAVRSLVEENAELRADALTRDEAQTVLDGLWVKPFTEANSALAGIRLRDKLNRIAARSTDKPEGE